ncbi:MAG: hypothetical protein ACKOFP_01760, partial [Actinomycetota bacterium]
MDSPAIARAVVEELLSAGVSDVVVCPGSRSAPLALTLADADRRSSAHRIDTPKPGRHVDGDVHARGLQGRGLRTM